VPVKCPAGASAANAGANIGASDSASAVIHDGDSVIQENVVPVQKSNMLVCAGYFFLNGKPIRSVYNSSGCVHNAIFLVSHRTKWCIIA